MANEGVALTSDDGTYMCTGDHALTVAMMVSRLEAHLHRHPDDRYDLGELILDYLSGDEDEASVMMVLVEWEENDPVKESDERTEEDAP
jgi:hypothetical protein